MLLKSLQRRPGKLASNIPIDKLRFSSAKLVEESAVSEVAFFKRRPFLFGQFPQKETQHRAFVDCRFHNVSRLLDLP